MEKRELVEKVKQYLAENPGERAELISDIQEIEVTKKEIEEDISRWANDQII